jgi:MFS family permease
MLEVLRRRDFGLLWFAGLVSVTGDWVLNSALPYFVYQQTGSTLATAGMTIAELVPGVALSSPAGVFVDRWDRRRVLLLTNLLQAATVLLLLLCTHGGFLWAVYAVGLAASVLQAFAGPAESSLLPTLVDRSDLVAANALNALNNRLGRLIGLPLGAALLAASDLAGVVLVDATSYLAAAGVVGLMTRSAGRPPPVEAPIDLPPATAEANAPRFYAAFIAFHAEWLEGLRLVRREPAIALVFVVLGLMTYGGTMLDPLSPAWVRDVLGQGPAVYAWLMVAHAVGGIGGSLVVGTLGARLPPRRLMGWFSIAASGLLLVRFNVPVVWLALTLALLNGATSVASAVGVDTLVQSAVPDRYRGRIFGTLGAWGALLSLVGALTGGVLGELIGIVPTLDLAAGLVGLAGLVVLVVYARPTESAPASRHDSDRSPEVSSP